MKLKQFTARILTAVMILASVSFPGDDTAMMQAYADEPAESTDEVVSSAPNIAKGKTVKASSRKVSDDNSSAAEHAVDGDAATAWTSGDITGAGGSNSAWLQIDLGSDVTDYPAEAITVKFNGTAWTENYTVKSSYTAVTANTDSWWVVQERESSSYKDDNGSKTDTFDRNRIGEKMVLRRYVRFEFEGLNEAAGDDVTGVSVAEIIINGTEPKIIPVPVGVTLEAPAENAYPTIADVASDESVHHTDLADRTTPASSFMRQDGTDTNWKDESRQIGKDDPTTVTAPLWEYTEDMAAGELTGDEFFAEDGVLGFNTQVHTPGTVNKFDVWKEDVVVASFQLYINSFPVAASGGNTERHLFAKGNKYRCVLNGSTINASLQDTSGTWRETKYQLNNNDLRRWIDVLMVIDGHGYMRLYVDGQPAATNNGVNGSSFLHAGEPANGFRPFSLCYSEGADRAGDGTILTEKSFLKKSEGYLARFKFYTDKDNNGLLNGAGTDISDSQQLSEEFVNALNIQSLEQAHGAANVGKVITNMLQSEQPTARITLCPYSRSTVWEKYDAETGKWTSMAVGEKFGGSTVKYRAITRLIADDGFLFDEDCRREMINHVYAGEDAQTTVSLTNKKRELNIISYYNCAVDDAAIEDTECNIEELILGESDVDEDYETSIINCIAGDDGTWADVEIIEPTAEVTTCTKHSAATVKYTYKLLEESAEGTNANEYMQLNVDESTGKATIKPLKKSKLTMGYAPLTVEVTATLMDEDGNQITKDGEVIQKSANIRVKIDEKQETEDTVIRYAPKVTVTAPKTNTYPRVATVAITAQAAHYDDIADRATPAASLVQLTNETRDQYLDEMVESGYINAKPADSDLDPIPEPTIVNKDSVFGFNAQGQTPGFVNKFDVVGRDVKVISFKLWLDKWPETKTNTPMVSLFGKGNQYAVQIDRSRKSIKMFMQPNSGQWPEEEYKPADADAFLGKWHTIFMVVDGKGKQRLYVDGNKSTTTKSADAYAKDPNENEKRQFTLGYNFEDGDGVHSGAASKNWWRQTFTADYGYFADFEFYTNKDYNHMVNGEGTDISRAEILSPEIASEINITELEKNSPNDLDAVITNLLQTSNPTVNITVNPYTAKTVWQQLDEQGNASEPEPTDPFKPASTYISTTTITAHDGFVFGQDIVNAVKEQFTVLPAAGETTVDEPTLTAKLSAKNGVENKVLTIVATYGETADVDCDCTMTDFVYPADKTSVEMMIEDGQENTTVLPALTAEETAAAITMQCPSKKHADAKYEYTLTYAADPSNAEGVIEFTPETRTVKGLKSGTAKIIVTAEAKLKGVADDEQISGTKIRRTAEIIITIDKKAGAAEKDGLQQTMNQAKTEYPDAESVYYDEEKWQDLQDALEAAETLKNDADATEVQINQAKADIEAAAEALRDPSAKSPLGTAKANAEAALAAAEALYNTANKDVSGKAVYTADSWNAFKNAYETLKNITPEDMAKMTAADLNALAEKLNNTAKEGADGLVKVTTGSDNGEISAKLKNNEEIKAADGMLYKVTDAAKNEVTVKKGTDIKKVKIASTVVLNTVTCKIVGIEKDAFKGFKRVTNVQVGDNVRFIGEMAFSGCKKLKAVTLGKSVQTIEKKAFFNSKRLKKVTLKGNAAPAIKKAAFKKTASKVTVKAKGLKGKKKKTAFLKKLRKPGGISKSSVVK